MPFAILIYSIVCFFVFTPHTASANGSFDARVHGIHPDLRMRLAASEGESNSIRVYIQFKTNALRTIEALESLSALGAVIYADDIDSGLVDVRIPHTAIDKISSWDVVELIKLPDYIEPDAPLSPLGDGKKPTGKPSLLRKPFVNGAEGAQALDSARIIGLDSNLELDGATLDGRGIKIGFIGPGIQGHEIVTASGDLPAGWNPEHYARVFGESDETPNAEGTAIMEIMHDAAPGAELYHADIDSTLTFIEAIDWLAHDVQVDIIASDKFFYFDSERNHENSGYFHNQGNDRLARRIKRLVEEEGIPFFKSAGNQATRHYSARMNPDHQGYHITRLEEDGSYYNYITVRLAPASSVDLFCIWDQPFGSATSQIDMQIGLGEHQDWLDFVTGSNPGFLVGDATETETISIRTFRYSSLPYQQIRIAAANDIEESQDIFVLFEKKGSRNRKFEFHLRTRKGASILHPDFPVPPVPGSSITNPGDAEGAYTVGATHGYIDADSGELVTWTSDPSPDDPERLELASYSSHGPTNDGRIRPHIVAPSRIFTHVGETMDERFSPFIGTSAAVPHVAAAAAIVLQAATPLNPQELYLTLSESAIPMEKYGAAFNNQSGFGFLNIPNAVTLAEGNRDTIERVTVSWPSPAAENERPFMIQGHARETSAGFSEFIGPVFIDDALRFSPLELHGPVLLDNFIQGWGQIHYLGTRHLGDLLIASGRYRFQRDGVIVPDPTGNSPIGKLAIADLNIEYATLYFQYFQGEFDPLNPFSTSSEAFLADWKLRKPFEDADEKPILKIFGASTEFGEIPFDMPSISVTQDVVSVDELKLTAGGLQLSARGVAYEDLAFSADELGGAFGSAGGIAFENIIIETDGSGISFDSGSANVGDAILTFNDGIISEDAGISSSGGTLSGIAALGEEPIEIPGFSIVDGIVTLNFDEPRRVNIAGFDAAVQGEFSFGGGQISFERAMVSINEQTSLELTGLTVSEGELQVESGGFLIPDIIDAELEGLAISQRLIDVPSAMIQFLAPGFDSAEVSAGLRIENGAVELTDDLEIEFEGFLAQFDEGIKLGGDSGITIPRAVLQITGGFEVEINNMSLQDGVWLSGDGLVEVPNIVSASIGQTQIGGSRLAIADAQGTLLLPGAAGESVTLPNILVEPGSIQLDFPQSEIRFGEFQVEYQGSFIADANGVSMPQFIINSNNGMIYRFGGFSLDLGSEGFAARDGMFELLQAEDDRILMTASFDRFELGPAGFSLSDCIVEFDEAVAGGALPSVSVQEIAISPEQFLFVLPPDEDVVIPIAGLEFTVSELSLEVSIESGRPLVSFGFSNALYESEAFAISIDEFAVIDNQLQLPGGATVIIPGLDSGIGLSGVEIDSGRFAAASATFALSDLVSFTATDTVFDSEQGRFAFTDSSMNIANILDAKFNGFEIVRGPVISIDGAELKLGNVNKKPDDSSGFGIAAETLRIGDGYLEIADAGFVLAGFDFSFSISHVPGSTFMLDVTMSFPQDRLPWDAVQGAIGVERQGGEARIVEFSFTISGGTIPGTDLGIRHLSVLYDQDGAPGGRGLFAGAGEFAIPNYFTVGLSAELYDRCLNSFSVAVRDMNIALGPSGVFFQDLGFSASGFCEFHQSPADATAIMPKWDALFNGSEFITDPSQLPERSFEELLLNPGLTGGVILPVNVSVKGKTPGAVFGNNDIVIAQPQTISQAAFTVRPLETVNSLGIFQSCEVDMQIPGEERVITFQIDIGLTAGPRVQGKAFASLDASGQFDTTGWLFIKGDLSILELPVAGAEFELNPSGPDCGVRLAMHVDLLQILKGAAEVRIDCAKQVSGWVEASLSVPEKWKIIGGMEFGAIEAFFSKEKVYGEVRFLKIPFGFRIENRRFSIGRNNAQIDPTAIASIFNQGFPARLERHDDTHQAIILTNWKKAQEGRRLANPGGASPQEIIGSLTYDLTEETDALIVTMQGGVEPIRASLAAPNGITYTSDPGNDPFVTELDASISEGVYNQLGNNVALLTIQDWEPVGRPVPGAPITPPIGTRIDDPSALSFILRNPPLGRYQIELLEYDETRDVVVEFLIPNQKPQIELSPPARQQDGVINIPFSASDSDNDATVEFYLDSDLEGGNGIFVGSIVERDGDGEFKFDPSLLPANTESDEIIQSATDWNGDLIVDATDFAIAAFEGVELESFQRPDAFAIPSGRYFITARADDGANAPVVVYGDSIVITNPDAPMAPSNVAVMSASGALIVTWDGSTDPDGDLVGYKVLLSDDLEGIGYEHSVGVDTRNQAPGASPEHSVIIPDLTNGHPYRIAVVAYDSMRNDSLYSESVIGAPLSPDGENAPYFMSTPPDIVRVGQTYRYAPIVRDLDLNQQRAFRLLNGPDGMQIDAARGNLAYQPSIDSVGSATVSIQVVDADGLSDVQTYQLRTLAPIESLPLDDRICSFPPRNARVGELYQYQIDMRCGGDILIGQPLPGGEPGESPFEILYRIIDGPEGMRVDSDGLVSWLPSSLQASSHAIALEACIIDAVGNEPPAYSRQAYTLFVSDSSERIAEPGTVFATPTPTPTATPTPNPPPPLPDGVAVADVKFFERDGSSGIDPERFALHPRATTIAILSERMNRYGSFFVEDDFDLIPRSLISQNINAPRNAIFAPKSELLIVASANRLHTARADIYSAALEAIGSVEFGLSDTDSPSELFISPNERFVYAAVRDSSRIMIYSLTPDNGELTLLRPYSIDAFTLSNASVAGFASSPRQDRLYAWSNKGDIAVLSLNPDNGLLSTLQELKPLSLPIFDLSLSLSGDSAIALSSNGNFTFYALNAEARLTRLSSTFLRQPVQAKHLIQDRSTGLIYRIAEDRVDVWRQTGEESIALLQTVYGVSIHPNMTSIDQAALADNGMLILLSRHEDESANTYITTLRIDPQSFEPVATPTPAPPLATPTPLARPTSTPLPINEGNVVIGDVNGSSLPVNIEFGEVPVDNAYEGATDGQGVSVTLEPGQGLFMPILPGVQWREPLAELSIAARATSQDVQIALIAVAMPIDGSIGYINPTASEIPLNEWGAIRFIYDSPTAEFLPVIQAFMPGSSGIQRASLYLDSLRIDSVEIADGEIVPFTIDSGFETIGDGAELNANLLLPPGAIAGSVFSGPGQSGQGIRLAIEPGQTAAHIAPFAAAPDYPAFLTKRVSVMRRADDDGTGTLGLVMTDGGQNIGYFLNMNHLPIDQFRQFTIGGWFASSSKPFQPISVIQLGGPNSVGDLVIDDLMLEQAGH